jgi:hypothetical protein
MKFSDEVLMAFADGELGEPVRGQVERAIRADPSLAARVAQHKAMRARVSVAFANIVNEAVPPRLYPGAAGAKVVQLNAVRAARQQQQQQARERPRWAWPQWGVLAASLVVGVLAGALGLHALQRDGDTMGVAGRDGALVAQGQLQQALSQQLASAATPGAAVKVGVSFLAKDNDYCRSFSMGSAAGLACGHGGQWTIPVLAQVGTVAGAGTGAAAAYRQAGSEIPAVVLDAIDQRIAGAALGPDEERAARQRGWKR